MAAALLVPEALKLTLGGTLEMLLSHSLAALLQARGHVWMTSNRLLKLHALLLEHHQVIVVKPDNWNPAVHLPPEQDPAPLSQLHDCLDVIDTQTKA